MTHELNKPRFDDRLRRAEPTHSDGKPRAYKVVTWGGSMSRREFIAVAGILGVSTSILNGCVEKGVEPEPKRKCPEYKVIKHQSHSDGIYDIAVSPGSSLLASTGYPSDGEGKVKLWNTDSLSLVNSRKLKALYVSFASNGQVLAAITKDGFLHLLNVPTLSTIAVKYTGQYAGLWSPSSSSHPFP